MWGVGQDCGEAVGGEVVKDVIDLEYRVGRDGKGYWETPRSRYERGYDWVGSGYSGLKNWVKGRVSSLYEVLLRYVGLGKKERPLSISYERSSEKSSVLGEKGIVRAEPYALLPHSYNLLPPAEERGEKKGFVQEESVKEVQEVPYQRAEPALEQRVAYEVAYEEGKVKPESAEAPNAFRPMKIINDGLAGARLRYFELFCMKKRLKESWWNPKRRGVYRRLRTWLWVQKDGGICVNAFAT